MEVTTISGRKGALARPARGQFTFLKVNVDRLWGRHPPREGFLEMWLRNVNQIEVAQIPSSEREEVTHAIDLPWNR